MAKQKPENEKSPETTAPTNGAGPEAAPQPEPEASPKVRRAAAAVEKAEEQLRKARERYDEVCTEAMDKLKAVREKSVGELVDDGLKLVRKYPGPGVIVAALLGLFLGRVFRR